MRTITAQTGFRRMIAAGEAAGGQRNGATGDEPAEVKEVDISFDHNGHRWYPGVEFLGEGLFITAVDDVVRDSKAAREWRGASKDGYDRYLSQHGLFRELGPAFVWWHTLSHALTPGPLENTPDTPPRPYGNGCTWRGGAAEYSCMQPSPATTARWAG